MSTYGSSSNNSHSGGVNHDGVGGKIAKESAGFLVAEGASMLTGLGVIAIADQIIPKSVLKGASKAVAKVVVEPFLDSIEYGMSHFCKLEECKVDKSVSREDRAEAIAKTLLVFGAAYVLSMEVKLRTRRGMNSWAKVIEDIPGELPKTATAWEKFKHYATFQHWSPQEKLIFAADEGVHLGSLYLLNNQLAPFTDDMIRKTSSVLQKSTGVSKQKADEVSTMFWVWEAANGLGAIAGIAAVAGNHSLGWATKGPLGKFLANKLPAQEATHVEKLALKEAASPHLSAGA